MRSGMVVVACLVVVVVVGLGGAGCVESQARTCGALVCSETAVCSPDGLRCVTQVQIDVCEGVADGTGCTFPGVPEGVCATGVCLGAGCGNGIVDPGSEELCDDGNRISLDGCSADCASDERCGDGVADLAVGERCDCGDASAGAVPGCMTSNADVGGAACRTDCTLSRCGDGVLDPVESCDDGNTVPGDGCRADCAGRWTRMYSGTFSTLHDVWGTAPDNVFAVGYRHLLHFDGTTWTSMPLPAGVVSDTYDRVWGSGSSDVWALAERRVDHYDGVTWTAGPEVVPDQYFGSALWGSGPNDLWVGCVQNNTGCLAHKTATWGTAFGFYAVQEMAGTAADNIYAVVDLANNSPYRLYRFNGASWNPVTGTASMDPVLALTASFVLPNAANDVLVFDSSGGQLSMRRFNGTAWTTTPCCIEVDGANDFGGVAGDYVMVGFEGRIWTSADALTWVVSPSAGTSSLNAVYSFGPGRAFIVGDNGTILY